MNKELQEIQNDTPKREALRQYMYKSLDELALQKLYAGESVLGIPETKKVIEQMFLKMDTEYGN